MVAKVNIWRHRKRWIAVAAAAIAVAGGSYGAVRLSRNAPQVPIATVQLGEFVDYVQIRGQISATKSVMLTAPPVTGDIQIIKVVRTGTAVKKGDVVVQFDVTKLRDTLNQKRSEMKQAEAEIEQARAKASLQEEQDQTDLLRARYDVDRAKLEVSKQEILSKIEGEEKKLDLGNAQQRLAEAEQKLEADRAAARAEINAMVQKRDNALAEVNRAQRDIGAMTLRAPVDGLVTLQPNWRGRGFSAGSAPEFKEGDLAWTGAGIAELPDLSTLEVQARIDEVDRGRLKTGQPAIIRVDAIPDKDFTGRVSEIGTLAKADFSVWPFPRNFDLAIKLDQLDPRLRPGMNATTRIAVDRVPNSILVPAQAVFEKGGAMVAYVLRGSTFEPRVVDVALRSEKQLAIAKGLKPEEKIALTDPTLAETKK